MAVVMMRMLAAAWLHTKMVYPPKDGYTIIHPSAAAADMLIMTTAMCQERLLHISVFSFLNICL